MEEKEDVYFEALKEKLIIAGIDEIEKHGVSDFSLRKVASACGASCSAPYKHFKNKEEFVNEIARYFSDKWELLRSQIESSVNGEKERITELCVANVRFRVSNPLYGRVFSPDCRSVDFIRSEVSWYCLSHPETDEKQAIFRLSAIVCGAAALILSGELENERETFEMIRQSVAQTLE